MPDEMTLISIMGLALLVIFIYLRINAGNSGVVQVDATEGQQLVNAGALLIDVRQPEEFSGGHAHGARLVPLDRLSAGMEDVPKTEPVVLICASGSRSRQAARLLSQAGYEKVVSVRGGVSAWKQYGLPLEK